MYHSGVAARRRQYVGDLLPRLSESQQAGVRKFLGSKPSQMQLLSLIEELEDLQPDLKLIADTHGVAANSIIPDAHRDDSSTRRRDWPPRAAGGASI
eukprot:COSAG02_NODE_76_length_41115_cov_60.967817_28_plen_97_part_00